MRSMAARERVLRASVEIRLGPQHLGGELKDFVLTDGGQSGGVLSVQGLQPHGASLQRHGWDDQR